MDKDKYNKNVKKLKSQTGGAVNKQDVNDYVLDDVPDYLNPTKFIKRDISGNGLKEFSFLSAVHDILKDSQLIPESVNVTDFYKDLNYDIVTDMEMDKKHIRKLANNLVIGHTSSSSAKNLNVALDGVNILVLDNEDDNLKIKCFGKREKLSRKEPSIILYNDGEKYYPIYKARGEGFFGLFDTRMRFVRDLIDYSDNELVGAKKKSRK